MKNNTRDETRTRKAKGRGILSPLRLPIPPPGRAVEFSGSLDQEKRQQCDDGDGENPEARARDVALKNGQVAAEIVSKQPEHHRPHHAAEGVEGDEPSERHARRAGDDRGPGAKHRDEAPEQDRLSAVPLEEAVRGGDVVSPDANVSTVTHQERQSTPHTDPVSEDAA